MKYEIETTWVECRQCGTPVAIASKIWDNLSANGGTFKCPLGHDIRPKAPDEIARLKEELAEVQRRLQCRDDDCIHWREMRARLEHVNASLRGYIGRLKRKAGAK